MQNISYYYNPIFGKILLAADENSLTGVWFEGQKYYAQCLDKNDCAEKETEIIKSSKLWLDIYFSGKQPDFTPQISFSGTPFQISVWKILCKIPYGKTITYGDIAKQIANQRSLKHMSAQAVGSAVGHNDISIIVPCHRVVGKNGTLTGYAGGVDKKLKLLTLEGICPETFKN